MKPLITVKLIMRMKKALNLSQISIGVRYLWIMDSRTDSESSPDNRILIESHELNDAISSIEIPAITKEAFLGGKITIKAVTIRNISR